MDLAELTREIEAQEKRYQEWVKPINQFIRERLFQVNIDGYTQDDYERDLKDVYDRQRALYDPFAEIYALLDRLCPAYLDATPEQRAGVRAAVADKNGMLSALLGYVYRSANRISSPSDREWLRKGLAAISIENCSKDFRDVLLALAELCVAAEAAGIDPRPDFRAVAALSSRGKPQGGSTSVSRMLGSFQRSAVLKERRKRGCRYGEGEPE
jgi:hypothetical protein